MKILNKKTFNAPGLADLICEHGYITQKRVYRVDIMLHQNSNDIPCGHSWYTTMDNISWHHLSLMSLGSWHNNE